MLMHAGLIESINIKRETHIIAQHNSAHRGAGELDKVLKPLPWGTLGTEAASAFVFESQRESTKRGQVLQQCPALHLKANLSAAKIRPEAAADIFSGAFS